jgi:hypothetical protein
MKISFLIALFSLVFVSEFISQKSFATDTTFEMNNQVVFVYDMNGDLAQVNKVSQ